MKLVTMFTMALLLAASTGFAAPQIEEGTPQGTCEIAEAPTADQIDEAQFASNESWLRGYWHCTAYPDGHGHHHGYSARDIHYSHAYYNAMRRCERATYHHCHDIHCHYDHH